MIPTGDAVSHATARYDCEWVKMSIVKTAANFVHHKICSVSYSSSTHVSLLPPPCEEFTTSEPFFNATRVKPPGMMLIFSP